MSNNVAEEIAERKPLLLQKIESNDDIANVLMALLGKLILECTARGFKLNAIIIGTIQENNNGRFASHVAFVENSLVIPSARIGIRSDFETYLGNKNSAMATLLRVNQSVARYFEAITMRLEQFAEHKRIRFNELKVITNGAFLSRDNELVITVGKEDTGVTNHRKLKNFFGL